VSSGGDPDLERVARALGELARREIPIGTLTTYRVGGAARVFCEPGSDAELERLVAALSGTAVPILVIGKGSNLLVADRGWDGVCVRLGEHFATIEPIEPGQPIEPGEPGATEVVAGAATAYPVLARRTAACGLTGLEWAVGIPGSVGGAVRMNAGGHGAETRDRLLGCRLVDLAAGADRWVPASALELEYRHSAVRPSELVVAARYRLDAGDVSESSARISEIVRWRRENQPGGQNAGSVFTNPPDDSAGRLIDLAGLKGRRVGSASVSEKHANFIQADVGGSADDVRQLVETVRKIVADRLGVELAVELRMVGWDPSPQQGDPSCS
jgi:UDP-N-acetylmuramate dehydrogenase